MADKPYLALDIGAASGRAILGRISSGLLRLEEIHRFEVKPVMLGGKLYWDFLFIWHNLLESLGKCAAAGATELAGIGIDTFNCDFGFLDASGSLLGNPVSYRDTSPAAVQDYVKRIIDDESLFRETGSGFSPISGLSRLVFLLKEPAGSLFRSVSRYLALPDLIRYFLTGIAVGEKTILWGSQLINIRAGTWSEKLIDLFDLPAEIFPNIVSPGTCTGELLPEIKRYSKIESAPVYAVAGHDTISASVSHFGVREETAFLSTGSWFILGTLLKEPETSPSAFRRGFVNEIGVNSILFAKNMMGFYVLEGLFARWKLEAGGCSYEQLMREAADQPTFSLKADVNDPVFFSSLNMIETMKDYLRKTGQEFPAAKGKLVRSIFESLAASCGKALSDLQDITGKTIHRIVMFGGGVKNPLLCRMMADAAGIDVVCGPAEAAAAGNIGMQLLATGAVRSDTELNALVRASFPGETYKLEGF